MTSDTVLITDSKTFEPPTQRSTTKKIGAETIGKNTTHGNHSHITKTTVTIETFNCHGFKESSDFILNRLSDVDFLCLTETWLRPQESNLINSLLIDHSNTRYEVFNKCGMTYSDNDLNGRPYGGLSVICRKNDQLCFSMLPCDSERICPILISDKRDNPLHIIVNVYMPYFDKSKNSQTDLFIETIDILQSFIDNYSGLAPIKLVGDFNAQLPTQKVAEKHLWERKGCYTKHSKILQDFLSANSLFTVDRWFDQTTNYTYFNIKRNVYTWLDHVISSQHCVNDIISCDIIPLDEHNVSDHLPIRTTFY